MLLRAFTSTLEVQQSNIERLLWVLKTKSMAEDMNSALVVNTGVKRNINELKTSPSWHTKC